MLPSPDLQVAASLIRHYCLVTSMKAIFFFNFSGGFVAHPPTLELAVIEKAAVSVVFKFNYLSFYPFIGLKRTSALVIFNWNYLTLCTLSNYDYLLNLSLRLNY